MKNSNKSTVPIQENKKVCSFDQFCFHPLLTLLQKRKPIFKCPPKNRNYNLNSRYNLWFHYQAQRGKLTAEKRKGKSHMKPWTYESIHFSFCVKRHRWSTRTKLLTGNLPSLGLCKNAGLLVSGFYWSGCHCIYVPGAIPRSPSVMLVLSTREFSPLCLSLPWV